MYLISGKIVNSIWKENTFVYEEIVTPEKAFYSKEGKAKAVFLYHLDQSEQN